MVYGLCARVKQSLQIEAHEHKLWGNREKDITWAICFQMELGLSCLRLTQRRPYSSSTCKYTILNKLTVHGEHASRTFPSPQLLLFSSSSFWKANPSFSTSLDWFFKASAELLLWLNIQDRGFLIA